MLTDGKRGSHDYDNNWVIFGGKDLEAVIDLEKVQKVERSDLAITSSDSGCDFCQQMWSITLRWMEKILSWWRNIKNTLPIDQYGGYLREFNTEFAPREARYIKVRACSMGNTPGWHPGAGRPAQMLVDEIVVE